MAKQIKFTWTRESAIEYLASNPAYHSKKPLSERSTEQLKRAASKFKHAEQEGRTAPTKAEERGHAGGVRREKIEPEHLAADKEKHILDQYVIHKPSSRDLDQADLRKLFNRAKRGKKLTTKAQVIITGVGIASPRFREKYRKGEVHTYSYPINLRNLKLTIEEVPDIFDFVADISQLEWQEVHAIAFAFPNPKS